MRCIHTRILHGEHCKHVNCANKKGESIFGKLVYNFIQTAMENTL